MACVGSTSAGVLDEALQLNSQVSVRPEPFGALLYHFGTRRLSFLKDRRLLEIVQHLAVTSTARDACELAGVSDDELSGFARALQTLVERGMVEARTV